MKERPILFSAPMVRAILDGSKTQTRRIVKPQPPSDATGVQRQSMGSHWWVKPSEVDSTPNVIAYEAVSDRFVCPHGQPGDHLWVRESGSISTDKTAWMYADSGGCLGPGAPCGSEAWAREWKPCPSIHMPRWASRITLEVTGVRVERLNDISDEDARAEGIDYDPGEGGFFHVPGLPGCCSDTAAGSFRKLWDAINGAESWDAKPWVWVIEFRRVT